MFNSVDLPDPDGPSSTIISPVRMSMSTPRNAWTPPAPIQYTLVSPLTRNAIPRRVIADAARGRGGHGALAGRFGTGAVPFATNRLERPPAAHAVTRCKTI